MRKRTRLRDTKDASACAPNCCDSPRRGRCRCGSATRLCVVGSRRPPQSRGRGPERLREKRKGRLCQCLILWSEVGGSGCGRRHRGGLTSCVAWRLRTDVDSRGFRVFRLRDDREGFEAKGRTSTGWLQMFRSESGLRRDSEFPPPPRELRPSLRPPVMLPLVGLALGGPCFD